MSVINQMLQELDQRNAGQGQSTSAPLVATKKTSTTKIVLISLVILLALNAVGLYVWQLISENKSLKLQAQSQANISPKQAKQVAIIEQAAPAVSHSDEAEQVKAKAVEAKAIKAKAIKAKAIKAKSVETKAVEAKAVEAKAIKVEPVQAKPTKAVPAKVTEAPTVKAKSKMTVSRRHLTEDELVAKKVAKAELALNREQISKAEKLFEDVLIIQPSNAKIRQKLAALWFGRKAYQQAGNLLSQGIAIDTENSDLRVMKAKIELKQHKYKAAYRTLKSLAKLQQQEYQILLANTAQQANQVNGAVNAYNELINMQPDSARWSLGLAIVYDKNSQFKLATAQYKLALNKNDLSASSATFAQQRIHALKE